MLEGFLAPVKGKDLEVSVFLDKDTQVWTGEESSQNSAVGLSEGSQLPSRNELLERVAGFKESLRLSPERLRQMEQETIDRRQSSL